MNNTIQIIKRKNSEKDIYRLNDLVIMLIAMSMSLFLLFCSSSNKVASPKNDPEYLNYEIVFSTGGGFTGSREGFLIDSSGIVRSFKGPIISKAVKDTIGQLRNELKITYTR